MRWAALIFALVATSTIATAQRPWGSYDERQRERIVEHRSTPDVVRRAVEGVETLDGEELEELWTIITHPTKSRHHASLYLYIYELLRPVDGSAHAADVDMLRCYAPYMLKRWCDQHHAYDVYNYAYALARHSVAGGDADDVLNVLSKRRFRRRYATLVASLEGGVAIAEASLRLDKEVFLDHTSPEVDCRVPREITGEEYAKVVGRVSPIAISGVCDGLYGTMVAECIACGGSHHSVVDATAHKNLRLVLSRSAEQGYISLEDGLGVWHTLPLRLYMLPSGGLFAIRESAEGACEGVVVGDMVDGAMYSTFVAVGGGAVGGVKCTDGSIYLWLQDGDRSSYYVLSIAEYGYRR